MQRKVIQQGPSTLMVSLPSKWVKENNIKKGEELTSNYNNFDEANTKENKFITKRYITRKT